jgi:hypothetical protein
MLISKQKALKNNRKSENQEVVGFFLFNLISGVEIEAVTDLL